MITISSVVKEILEESEVARLALQKGWLSFSSFAQDIHQEVEDRTKKEVKLGSIVVALSRLAKQKAYTTSLVPDVVIEHISLKMGLSELVYEKTVENLAHLVELYKHIEQKPTDFFVVTQGVGEIALVVHNAYVAAIDKIYKKAKPILVKKGLAAITLRFSAEQFDLPNIIFGFLQPLALNRMVIAELISTYREITFVVEEDVVESVLHVIRKRFGET